VSRARVDASTTSASFFDQQRHVTSVTSCRSASLATAASNAAPFSPAGYDKNMNVQPIRAHCERPSHHVSVEYRLIVQERDLKLECGPIANVMAALSNIGGVAPSVQRRKVWLMPGTGVPCSNAAKTRNPLKLAGVPQTTGSISAAIRPKSTIL